MRTRSDDTTEDVDVQLTPLIDCVFLLLVFFLLAATLRKPHKELEIQLPQSAAAATVATRHNTLVIEMTKDGDIYIESEPMTTQLLNEKLHMIYAEDRNQRVRIDSDRRTAVWHVVRLLDHLQFVGLTNVGVRTKD